MYKIETEAKDLVSHGVSVYAGCGLELVPRNVIRMLGEDTVATIPPGCAALFSKADNVMNMKIVSYQCNLENTTTSAAGVRAGLDAQGNKHTTVLVSIEDDATADVGLQSLSGVTKHGDQVLHICYDSEAYTNTGIRGSSAVPYGTNTITTSAGKPTYKKDLLKIAIAHYVSYVASCPVANLLDLVKKVKKAKDMSGPSLLHVHTPCPTGWAFPPTKSVEVRRMAIETGAWVLYEYGKRRTAINKKVKELEPIGDYLSLQGRFKNTTEVDMKTLQREMAARYEKLLASER